MKPVYLEVLVPEYYCEDIEVDGADEMPCMSTNGMHWNPIIELDSGKIINWTKGATAELCIKVSDTGIYHLLDADKRRIYKYQDSYVPDAYLVHTKERGFGDYIQFDVDTDGVIRNYKKPDFKIEDWIELEGELNLGELELIVKSDSHLMLGAVERTGFDVELMSKIINFAKAEAKKRITSGEYTHV